MNRIQAVALAMLAAAVLPAAAQAQYTDSGSFAPRSGAALGPEDRLGEPFNPNGRYDTAITSPEAFIGYPIGRRFTPHHRVISWFEQAAEQSDRAVWELYGTTEEGRPLGTMTISSPGNMARIEEIRKDILRLAEPLKAEEARSLARRMPIVVWLSYNVHGDEASSSEAALAVAYELVAGTGQDALSLLDSLIVIIDPCLNPDGRDRYVNWVTTATGRQANPGPDAWEHRQPWPGGRYNHYLFDLNRDWAWLTQKETVARHAAYLRWRPQVHVDFHEMSYGSSYFFFPAAEPINTNLLPQVRYWGEVFGAGNAAAFDERGWAYYTSEEFDLYYPGYGDSWPTLQGATGMTYEQAGHGRAGTMIERSDGTILTLRERALHHYVASLATLRTARRERVKRLYHFFEYFDAGRNDPLTGPAAYLFPPGDDPGRTAELMNLLLRHGAWIKQASKPLKVSDPRGYDGRAVKRTFPEGTYVVPMRQPLRALLNSLLEPEADLPETLFYDVSAWSLPLASGVDAYWTDTEPGGLPARITEVAWPNGGIVGGPARVAWLLPWNTNAAPKLLNRLLTMGVRASFATREFETEGRLFERGTVVIPVAGNPDTLEAVIDRLSRELHQPVYAARSGLTGTGIDLGSDRVVPIRQPRVAIVNGDGVDPTSFGALWYLLDVQYGIPATVVPLDELASSNLSAWNVLVFPNDATGQGAGYESLLDSLSVDRLKRWASAGGVFIGLKGGAAWATAGASGLTGVALKSEEEEDEEEDKKAKKEEDLAKRLQTVEEKERSERLKQVPGTILSVTLDPGHPLAFGYSGEAHILKTSDILFEPTANGQNVGFYPESPRVSGYLSRDVERRITRTSFLIVEPIGRGRAVLYNDDPNFRVFWYGLNRLFLNSLFFASGI
jgi:hypothetical protein